MTLADPDIPTEAEVQADLTANGEARRAKRYCAGCDDDYYNHPEQSGVHECWSLKTAKVVERWRIGWWTPTGPGNDEKVTTFDCHTERGRFGFLKEPIR